MGSAVRFNRVIGSDNDLLVFNTHASDVNLDQRKQSKLGKARSCFDKRFIVDRHDHARCCPDLSPNIYIQATAHQSLFSPPHSTMSHRHLSRQPDRDTHPHQLIHQSSSTTAVPPTAPNASAQPPSIIHKLNTANEQTWLLIGTSMKNT